MAGMVEAAGALDAWGSNVLGGLVGGLLGAAFVVLGVRYGQKLSDDRKAIADRRTAGTGLVIQISNLRDDACSRSRGTTGDYAMWRMRNDLFVTHSVLDGYASYREARAFYDTVYEWREWARTHPPPEGGHQGETAKTLSVYKAELRSYSEALIKLLQEQLEADPISFRRPTLPALAWRSD